ncbi:hypothetical protein NDU88_004456 [Pleurodeles waltl]|uniref:Uncharacterized protein n=1 Tax=Pleurodeles waltl TaxID=8319 RepID=A0AAV7M894_PLEWA|nr:hypothetical protein NDU88_004456 [Pleurodeles waltl]
MAVLGGRPGAPPAYGLSGTASPSIARQARGRRPGSKVLDVGLAWCPAQDKRFPGPREETAETAGTPQGTRGCPIE